MKPQRLSFLLRLCTISTLVSFLSACAFWNSKPPLQPLDLSQTNWPAIQQELNTLVRWKMTGKIGIRSQRESLTAAINQWSQDKDTFIIDLSSTFLGLGATRVIGNSEFLTIIESGEDAVSSDNPDALMESSLGLALPISHLPFWIKATPVPNIDFDIQFNTQGLPQTIFQNGWHIDYTKYALEKQLPLPGKIKLKRDDTQITLAIKQWTIQ